MPRLIDVQTRTNTLTLAINHVIATDGIAGLSLRRIAEVSRVSAPTMISHFGSRERLLKIAGHETAHDRMRAFVTGQPYTGLMALLPGPDEGNFSEDPVVLARVWQGWMELWRSLPALEHPFARHYATLREFLAVLTQGCLSPESINGILAMSEGLQQQMAHPVVPLAAGTARELLTLHLERQGVPASLVARGGRIPDHLAPAINWMRRSVLAQ